jgi:hypothetical protein
MRSCFRLISEGKSYSRSASVAYIPLLMVRVFRTWLLLVEADGQVDLLI